MVSYIKISLSAGRQGVTRVGIDKKIVKSVAFLSRIELDEKELEIYSRQLASIVSYINKLKEIDTKTVPPTSHPMAALKNVFRKDILKKSLELDDVLKNAPSKEGDSFKVPQIIECK